jgi:uncharacterized protein (DUF2252 family)
MIKRHQGRISSPGITEKLPGHAVTVAKRSFAGNPSRAELYQRGKALRDKCPRQSHAIWKAHMSRPDPVALLEESSKGRVPNLIAIRYGRMLHSPFTFYRGAALNMAVDLSQTPVSGLWVQACGDCHLLNFGAFATPERRVIFDINDLDETLPAPWEWDVKRLAASFVLACRNNGFSENAARDTVMSCVRSYRHRMAEYSEMRAVEVWYASLNAEEVIPMIEDDQARKRIQKRLGAARKQRVMEHDFPKLAEVVGRLPLIKDHPPLIYHWRQSHHKEFFAMVEAVLARYRNTLEDDRRVLLDRYELRDVAVKVVGVGSVGTRCGIVLLMAGDKDPLFLQVKEAGPSVLERFAGKSSYSNHGQRVVNGCRLMQSASDIFLGWTVGPERRHFYIRQLHDMKIKILVETFGRNVMTQYAKFCGWALALAHARSGQPAMISGYLGKSDKFDKAISDFAIAYADQSERDHKILMKAVQKGRLKVEIEEE